MEKSTNCIFCDKPTFEYHNCRVCHSCNAVMNFSLCPAELFAEVKKCINSIQQYIESVHDMLYDIEYRQINQKHLSEKEQQIYDFCRRFQACRSELNLMISNQIHPQDIHFRKNLYLLLELSQDFSTVFQHECHVLTI